MVLLWYYLFHALQTLGDIGEGNSMTTLSPFCDGLRERKRRLVHISFQHLALAVG
jgi:hypothetical protein